MSPSSPMARDVSTVARGGALTLLGSGVGALMGLLFVVVVGRTLGPVGSGVVLQGIAAFTIAMGVARFGLDTTSVWLLPRLLEEDPAAVRSAVVGVVAPAVVLGCAAGATLVLVAEQLTTQEALARALQTMGWALPTATLTTVALAVTRALGGVRMYVGVGNVAIPALRPALAWIAVHLGGGAVAVALSWTLPFHAAAVVTLVVVLHQLNQRVGASPWTRQAWVPTKRVTGRIWSFALPRAVATALEQAMAWLDILVVGILAGPGAAGIYGAATRFVGAGMLLSTSLRVVVAPMYSRHLGAGRLTEVQYLYSVTTRWIVLFSAPVYVLVALYGGTVLGILGPRFREGAAALAVLAAGMALVLVAGNVQSVLLMSGQSALVAVNKALAVLTNVVLLLALVPRAGLLGAALAWVAAMGVDTGLALWQVSRRVGLRPAGRETWLAIAVVLVAVAAPGGLCRAFLGDTVSGLLLSIALGGLVHALLLWLLRVRFQITGLAAMARRQRNGV